MSDAPSDHGIHPGARQIVRRCLGLEPGQDLVVFLDETTLDVAVALAEAAYSLGVHSSLVLTPVSFQRRIPRQADLSLPVQGLAHQARGILICVAALPDGLDFRDRVLETQWSARTRVGHMPGATLDVFDLADVDMDRLIADCHAVELALAHGRQVELISHALDGKAHTLTADIGGWERLPVASDGVIPDGAWGNVPSGETYIAPIEGSAEGTVAITGSLPGRALAPGEYLMLHFRDGRLVKVEPEGSPAARWLNEHQIQAAKAKGDLNWSNLAEIGVGLNPKVTTLTGSMLFDEKAAGTAHVALGSSTFMGGRVMSAIHCDMVTRGPTVRVDGLTVVDRGQLSIATADWQENHAHVRLEGSPMATAGQVARSGVQAAVSGDYRLQRVLRPEPGRVSTCPVGDDATAWLANSIYNLLPSDSGWCGLDALASRAKLDRKVAQHVLHVMWAYGLINVKP
jgi:leucyl aminopeptidase (aminopeptidase T)